MQAYVSIAWDHRSEGISHTVELITTRLREKTPLQSACFDQPGLRVLAPPAGPDRPRCTCLRKGLILGTFFPFAENGSAYSTTPSQSLTESEEAALYQTDGRSLITSHWGSYVLFISDPKSASSIVVRGPMSSLPCFWMEMGGITLFFSRPADLLDILPLSINWDHICAQAVKGDYLCQETGLQGVFSLLTGDCMTLQPKGRAHLTYWSPSCASRRGSRPDLASAAGLLGSTTRAVIDCWCSLHDSILVALSGGFDSSVVLSCAAAAPTGPMVRAVTLYSRGSADERRYARSAAQKTGVPLQEVELPSDVDFSALLECSRTASPVLNFSAFATEPAFRQLSHIYQASAVLTGELGDCVLGHGFGPELLAEALWRYKLSLRAFRVILDYATLYRTSIWKATGLALAEYRAHRWSRSLGVYQRRKARGVVQGSCLASAEAIALYDRIASRFIHPWFRDALDGPPGWLQTIATMALLTSTSCQAPVCGAIDELFLSPLASQPLVEVFLSIPADLHITGSRSAAIARMAFASQLSREVLGRGRGKGTPELWLRDAIARNRPFVRELLLDGLLVKQGILDRGRIDASLSGSLTHERTSVVDIVTQLYIESWLRRWNSAIGQNADLLRREDHR